MLDTARRIVNAVDPNAKLSPEEVRLITRASLVHVAELVSGPMRARLYVFHCQLREARAETQDGWPTAGSLAAVLERHDRNLAQRARHIVETRPNLTKLLKFVDDTQYTTPQNYVDGHSPIHAFRPGAAMMPMSAAMMVNQHAMMLYHQQAAAMRVPMMVGGPPMHPQYAAAANMVAAARHQSMMAQPPQRPGT